MQLCPFCKRPLNNNHCPTCGVTFNVANKQAKVTEVTKRPPHIAASFAVMSTVFNNKDNVIAVYSPFQLFDSNFDLKNVVIVVRKKFDTLLNVVHTADVKEETLSGKVPIFLYGIFSYKLMDMTYGAMTIDFDGNHIPVLTTDIVTESQFQFYCYAYSNMNFLKSITMKQVIAKLCCLNVIQYFSPDKVTPTDTLLMVALALSSHWKQIPYSKKADIYISNIVDYFNKLAVKMRIMCQSKDFSAIIEQCYTSIPMYSDSARSFIDGVLRLYAGANPELFPFTKPGGTGFTLLDPTAENGYAVEAFAMLNEIRENITLCSELHFKECVLRSFVKPFNIPDGVDTTDFAVKVYEELS